MPEKSYPNYRLVERLEEPADDLLWGVPRIAKFIGKSLTETQYLIRMGLLPIGRLGPKTIFSSKKELRHHLTPKIPA